MLADGHGPGPVGQDLLRRRQSGQRGCAPDNHAIDYGYDSMGNVDEVDHRQDRCRRPVSRLRQDQPAEDRHQPGRRYTYTYKPQPRQDRQPAQPAGSPATPTPPTASR